VKETNQKQQQRTAKKQRNDRRKYSKRTYLAMAAYGAAAVCAGRSLLLNT
jgi:hypothetical protein